MKSKSNLIAIAEWRDGKYFVVTDNGSFEEPFVKDGIDIFLAWKRIGAKLGCRTTVCLPEAHSIATLEFYEDFIEYL